MLAKYIKWLAAAAAVAAVAGLNALAAALGVPVADLDPLLQGLIAAGVVKLVNYLVGKIKLPA